MTRVAGAVAAAPLWVAVALALVGAGCGTEEWSFRDPSGAGLDASKGTTDDATDASEVDATDDSEDVAIEDARAMPDAGCRDDSDCSPGNGCDTSTHRCVPMCGSSNGQCPCTSDKSCPSMRPHCDRSLGRCVRCLGNSDCPQGQSCDPGSHTCVY